MMMLKRNWTLVISYVRITGQQAKFFKLGANLKHKNYLHIPETSIIYDKTNRGFCNPHAINCTHDVVNVAVELHIIPL